MSQSIVSATEDSDEELFHHPSWPERWTHPEFTVSHDERRARWIQQRWLKDRKRTSVRFMGSFKWPWGFIIYRTVYTPESDQVWSACLDQINSCVRWAIDQHGAKYADQTPERILKETFKNVILQDQGRWDGSSVEQIRADFIAHLESIGSSIGDEVPRSTVCLVIDDECLQSIVRSLDDAEHGGGSGAPMGFVGMIDPNYAEGQSYCNMEYRGYMRVQIDWLYELVARQLIQFSMDEICPRVYDDMRPRVIAPGKVPIYTGL